MSEGETEKPNPTNAPKGAEKEGVLWPRRWPRLRLWKLLSLVRWPLKSSRSWKPCLPRARSRATARRMIASVLQTSPLARSLQKLGKVTLLRLRTLPLSLGSVPQRLRQSARLWVGTRFPRPKRSTSTACSFKCGDSQESPAMSLHTRPAWFPLSPCGAFFYL